MIKANEYSRLKEGDVFCFQDSKGNKELGKLLYAFPRKNYRYDKNGEITTEFDWVPWRCGYTPLNDSIRISVHLEAGLFKIWPAT